MAQFSRMKKYQDLRERLEEETTETSSNTKKDFSRSSRNTSNTPGHANRPVRASHDAKVTPITNQVPNSPVMDDLIDEVKQYNLDNGNIVSDDTQINILKQLDGTQLKHRNSHFVPMEEDEEELGSTMKLPVSDIEEAFPNEVPEVKEEEMEYYEEPAVDDGPSILPISENPEPVQPLEPQPEPEVISDYFKQQPSQPAEEKADTPAEEVSVEPATEDMNTDAVQPVEDTKEQIVLTSEDFHRAEQDELTSDEELDQYFAEDREPEEEEPKPVSKKKKTKKTAMPSEKKKQEVKTKKAKSAQQRSNMFLNIILAVLIIALIIAIGVTVYYITRLG